MTEPFPSREQITKAISRLPGQLTYQFGSNLAGDLSEAISDIINEDACRLVSWGIDWSAVVSPCIPPKTSGPIYVGR